MDKAYLKAIYELAIAKFGDAKQVVKAIEELSELQTELCRVFCDRGNEDRLIEEIVDVEIMLEQVKMIFDIPEEIIEEVKIQKVERLEKRLVGITIYDRVDCSEEFAKEHEVCADGIEETSV